jgi:predicted transcriptional regulator
MLSRTEVDGRGVSAPSPLAPGLTNVASDAQHPGGMARSRIVAGHRIGALEAEVLGHLWEATEPLSVRDIMSRLKGRRRAYTTVMTVLTRLYEKGLVERVLSGKAYLYRASGTPAEIEARRIQDLLAASEDPKAVLAHFVEELAKDPDLLRTLDRLRRGRSTR